MQAAKPTAAASLRVALLSPRPPMGGAPPSAPSLGVTTTKVSNVPVSPGVVPALGVQAALPRDSIASRFQIVCCGQTNFL